MRSLSHLNRSLPDLAAVSNSFLTLVMIFFNAQASYKMTWHAELKNRTMSRGGFLPCRSVTWDRCTFWHSISSVIDHSPYLRVLDSLAFEFSLLSFSDRWVWLLSDNNRDRSRTSAVPERWRTRADSITLRDGKNRKMSVMGRSSFWAL